MPVWQALRAELNSQGFEVVTVACDSKGRETIARWIEAATPQHPSLIDTEHAVPELYNTRNVPAAFWIDEDGRIVRPNDPVYAQRRSREGEVSVNDKYLDAVRDWVRKGSDSIFVVGPDTARERIGESDQANAEAAAHFRLGLHLHRHGHEADALEHFKRAHTLKPENWNYKRQAWTYGDMERDFQTTFQQELQKGIPFYPPLDLPEGS